MVCNMAADEVRALAKLVDEERAVSAQPLVEHVCAMCGHLLQSRAREGWTEVDIGKPGEAHQSRGQKECAWDELPPFLLLFSKDTLARRLPSIFELTAGAGGARQLRLRHGVTRLPWLHYKSAEKQDGEKQTPCKALYAKDLHTSRPWWHCTTC